MQRKKLWLSTRRWVSFFSTNVCRMVASAPAIFQGHLKQLLSEIEGCGNYLDDIIIFAPILDQHLARLKQILCILQANCIQF